MRRVFNAVLGSEVSVLGFGCASLGSRVSSRAGRRALDAAFDHGICWFDTAPPYGDGRSEEILGGFLHGKRDKVMVCTKAGILRTEMRGMKSLLRSALRHAVTFSPKLRAQLAKARRLQVHTPITATMIEYSLAESLRKLKTSYVDILALHEPTPAEAASSEICDCLDRILDKGYARAVGIAGEIESVIAGFSAFPRYKFVQLADDPFVRNLDHFSSLKGDARPVIQVTHSVFGVNAALTKMECLLTANPDLAGSIFGTLVRADQKQFAAKLLLDYAFANNSDGLVLLSMFNSAHLSENVARASSEPNLQLKSNVDRLLSLAANCG